MRLIFVVVLLLAVACTALLTRSIVMQSGGGGAAMDPNAVRDAVIETLRNEPAAVLTALTEGQQKLMQQQQEERSKKIGEMREQIENDPRAAAAGNPGGDVTVVEFYDYKCGHCRHVAPFIQTLLEEDKNLRVIFKEFPILSEASVRLARISMAVHALYPAKFFEFHLEALKKGPDTDAQIAQIVSAMGMDSAKILAEAEKPEYQEYIDKERAFGASVGIQGTPAFLINGEFVPGAMELDAFRQKIAAARAR